jgi:hypothetical protein
MMMNETCQEQAASKAWVLHNPRLWVLHRQCWQTSAQVLSCSGIHASVLLLSWPLQIVPVSAQESSTSRGAQATEAFALSHDNLSAHF